VPTTLVVAQLPLRLATAIIKMQAVSLRNRINYLV
jgi:hypothetical protein